MTAKVIYKLAHAVARARAVAAVEKAEDGTVVTLGPPKRSLDQNALLHGLLTEACRKGLAADNGRRLDVDDAKTAVMTAWMIETGQASDIIAFSGRPIQLRRSTASLNKAEFSSLVEFVLAECAHRNIHLTRIAP